MTEAQIIAEGLSEAQREYMRHGPYHHWTRTRKALARKGISSLVGVRGFNELGEQVRQILQEQNK